jgi:DNA-binding response OmpR family regulator
MTNKSALIIEDDDDLSTIFAEAVRAAGYEPEIIRDGEVARTRLANTQPDVVVLDLHLPHVAGTSLLSQIRADPRLAGIRVVVATADPRMAEITRSQADIVLIKPISFSLLRDLTVRLSEGSGKQTGAG